MQTVMIYDQLGNDSIKFAILEGDYRHLNEVYINGDFDDEVVTELSDLIYGDDGKEKVQFSYEFPVGAVKSGAFVIVAGFLP